MGKKTVLLVMVCLALTLTFFGNLCFAGYLDEEKTLFVTGKVQTRNSWRTDDSEGYTKPEADAGEWVQSRNLAYIQLDHEFPYVLKSTGWDFKYHLLGRFLYEGIYDYGSSQFQRLRDDQNDWVGAPSKERIDDLKTDADLWEGYFDLSKGAFFLRIGKQNLSWGETDVYRLSDVINPLDDTYGGVFEDLDDRRIPLNMIRSSYNIGRIAGINSVTVEGFLVPGVYENKTAPIAAYYTPYSPPLTDSQLAVPVREVALDDDMQSSRFGVRLQGTIGTNLSLGLSYTESYSDTAASRLVLEDPTDPSSVYTEMSFQKVKVTAGSMNAYIPALDTIVRSEIAYFQDEPIYIGSTNMPLYTAFINPSDPSTMIMSDGLPASVSSSTDPLVIPGTGEIPKADFFKFSVSFDRQQWIRFLNSKKMFDLTFQYFGSYNLDYEEWYTDSGMVSVTQGSLAGLTLVPVSGRGYTGIAIVDPDTGEDIKLKQYEQSLTFIAMTSYLDGSLEPELVASYDPRGVWLLMPSVAYKFGPGRSYEFKVQYAGIFGSFVNVGIFQDRDQVSAILTYNF